MARRTRILGFLAAIISVLLVFWAPLAIAGPDEAPGQQKKAANEARDKDGDADSDSGTAFTEDNDTNDDGTPENVADEGDNEHPSGKDRSVEGGNSGTQGKSESNPDDTNGPMRSEGEAGQPDKANGSGGTDLADQDGNNGCGNDDDFDDDNNGWCGKPTETESGGTPPLVEGEVIVDVPCVRGSMEDEKCGSPTFPEVVTNPSAPEDVVLGERITRGGRVAAAVAPAAVEAAVEAEGATLPFTGGSVVQLLVTGLSLVTLGGVSVLARKR